MEHCRGVSGITVPSLRQSVEELEITMVGWEVSRWGNRASPTGLFDVILELISKGWDLGARQTRGSPLLELRLGIIIEETEARGFRRWRFKGNKLGTCEGPTGIVTGRLGVGRCLFEMLQGMSIMDRISLIFNGLRGL